MNNKLYRVDNELLTCVEVDKENLHEDTPIGYWLPVMFGDGEYCYYEDESMAKDVLINIVKAKIDDLYTIINELENRK